MNYIIMYIQLVQIISTEHLVAVLVVVFIDVVTTVS